MCQLNLICTRAYRRTMAPIRGSQVWTRTSCRRRRLFPWPRVASGIMPVLRVAVCGMWLLCIATEPESLGFSGRLGRGRRRETQTPLHSASWLADGRASEKRKKWPFFQECMFVHTGQPDSPGHQRFIPEFGLGWLALHVLAARQPPPPRPARTPGLPGQASRA